MVDLLFAISFLYTFLSQEDELRFGVSWYPPFRKTGMDVRRSWDSAFNPQALLNKPWDI